MSGTAGQFSTSAILSQNLYFAKFNADGSDLIYSTLLGPAVATAMKTDARGDIYITCAAAGSPFPTIAASFGATQPAAGDNNFLFYVRSDGVTCHLPRTLSVGSMWIRQATYILQATITAVPFQMSSGAFQTASGPVGPGGPAGDFEEGVIVKITPDGEVVGATYLGRTAGAEVR